MAGKSKDLERRLARAKFLSTEKISFKELAKEFGVLPHTIGEWAREENWKALKAAKIVSKDSSVSNAYFLLDNLMQKAVDLAAKGEDTAKVTNEIAQINKTIEALTGEIPLDTIINVLEQFLEAVPHGHKTKDFKTDRELMAIYQTDFLFKKAKEMSITN